MLEERGNIINKVEEQLRFWKSYIFSDTGADITKKVSHTINGKKTGKATGLYELPTEIIKLIKDHNLKMIVGLFSIIYKSYKIRKEWLMTIIITIPKKPRKCAENILENHSL